MTERIEAQIERFAPGFRDVILARSTRGPAEMELRNANPVGGNITGGANTLRQLVWRRHGGSIRLRSMDYFCVRLRRRRERECTRDVRVSCGATGAEIFGTVSEFTG